MAKGIALTIGLNEVDPNHYAGWSGPLNACEADANDMADIAESKGFKTLSLLTAEATRSNVLEQITKAAATLQDGDIFMLTYSGHGGQLEDYNDDEDDDRYDETWCLFNGQLVDDEIHAELAAFAPGVRVLMFSDSCHSGTVARGFPGPPDFVATPTSSNGGNGSRAIPLDALRRTYRANQAFYDKILKNKKLRGALNSVQASILLISGCQDNQLSLDGAFNGLFTGTLLHVWNNAKFKGDYRKFHRSIRKKMPATQSPNFFWAASPDPAFEAQAPFTI